MLRCLLLISSACCLRFVGMHRLEGFPAVEYALRGVASFAENSPMPARFQLENGIESNEDDDEILRKLRICTNQLPQICAGHAVDIVKSFARDKYWVLIINPREPNEGVYTLEGDRVYVVMFEEYEEAWRFVQLLHADDFPLLEPTAWTADDVVDFCQRYEFYVSLIPAGTFIVPPRRNSHVETDDVELERTRLEEQWEEES